MLKIFLLTTILGLTVHAYDIPTLSNKQLGDEISKLTQELQRRLTNQVKFVSRAECELQKYSYDETLYINQYNILTGEKKLLLGVYTRGSCEGYRKLFNSIFESELNGEQKLRLSYVESAGSDQNRSIVFSGKDDYKRDDSGSKMKELWYDYSNYMHKNNFSYYDEYPDQNIQKLAMVATKDGVIYLQKFEQ